MITQQDISALREVFRGARRYAGDNKDQQGLQDLIGYEEDLVNRILETIKPKKKKNGKD